MVAIRAKHQTKSGGPRAGGCGKDETERREKVRGARKVRGAKSGVKVNEADKRDGVTDNKRAKHVTAQSTETAETDATPVLC